MSSQVSHFCVVGMVTALDRTNAEHAVLPIPKLHTHDKKRKHLMTELTADIEDSITDPIIKEVKKPSTDRRGTIFFLFNG